MTVIRRLEALVRNRLATRPGVMLLSPRQVGKTTLARRIADSWTAGAVYLDLERPADQRRLEDADGFLRDQGSALCIIDEVQRSPDLFPILRGIIDERRRQGDEAGHVLLLGSAALDLMHQASESLAGRIAYLELHPFDSMEVAGAKHLQTLWNRGGFPQSFLAPNDHESMIWRDDFIRSYLERDVPMFAPRLPSETIGRLWTMLANAQGGLLQASRLATSLAISASSVARYIDLLTDLLLIRRLPPWSANIGKRLVRSPKIYVRDSGLVHALLGLETLYDVLGHVVAGASWEGFVIENIIAATEPLFRPYFYRTEDGAEIDLLLERGGRVEYAIEIKRSSAPQVSKGFHLACAALGPTHRVIIHGGEGTWTTPDGTVAHSLDAFIATLL